MNSFTYNTSIIGEASIPLLIANTPSLGDNYNTFYRVRVINGNIYTAGAYGNLFLVAFNEQTRQLVQRVNYAGTVYDSTTGAIDFSQNRMYAASSGNLRNHVKSFYLNNFAFEASYNVGSEISAVGTNNGFVYVGQYKISGINRGLTKLNQSLSSVVGTLPNFGNAPNYLYTYIFGINFNNNHLFVTGIASDSSNGIINNPVLKYHESNLVLAASSANFSNIGSKLFRNVTISNNFVYTGGGGWLVKLHEENLATVGLVDISSISGLGEVSEAQVVGNYIYMVGGSNRLHSFHSGNLVYVGNVAYPTSRAFYGLAYSNGNLYPGGWYTPYDIPVYTTLIPQPNTAYKINKIKE
jgi:hypothetical protein